jgi:hypothetical protein
MAKIKQEWTKIGKRNINQPFLATFFEKMKIDTSLYFVKSEPPKSPPMEVGCELQLLSRRMKGYLYNKGHRQLD